MTTRHYNFMDELCSQADTFLKTVFGKPETTPRPNPAAGIKEPTLTEEERKHAAGLMRINHTGEVCAQALYQGQALTARSKIVRSKMQQAAAEENDHLAWCKGRLKELDSHTSRLNLIFYIGAVTLGATAGAIGDKWSLGFLAETEHQVCQHLNLHLGKLPEADNKSHLIVQQMRDDEAKHKEMAFEAGAAELPNWTRKLMKTSSKIMTKTTYWI